MKTLFFNNVCEITPFLLERLNIKCILLDIDNTIKPYGAKAPHDKIEGWIREIEKYGVKIILCSNNYKKNVKPIADMLNCDFVSFCLKPSPFGFFRAKLKSKTSHDNILVVGDQLFTDILGGKLLFLKTALIEPMDLQSESSTVKLRRRLLKTKTDKIKNRKNPF